MAYAVNNKIKIVLLFLILTTRLQADALGELRAYINNRTGQTISAAGAHCAFEQQLQLKFLFNQLNPKLQSAAASLLNEPLRQDSVLSPSGHFMLHYDTVGTNAVPTEDLSQNGIPDYVDSAMAILDHVWDVEIGQLGFQPPLGINGKPRSSYPIYFTTSGIYYGWTTPDQKITALSGNKYTSFIEINANFYQTHFYTNGLNAMRVTCAHEFNHALQLGYTFRIDSFNNYTDLFFMEMTSTWLEDYIYNNVNDYYFYLKRFIPQADAIRFNATDQNSEYANSIYLHMFQKEYGPKIVPEIWREIENEPALEALDKVLKRKGSSFARSHNQYACWLYFTGTRSISGSYFPEAAFYPELRLSDGLDALEQSLKALHMRHIKYELAKTSIWYKAKLSADDNRGMMNHLANGNDCGNAVPFGKTQLFYQDTTLVVVVLTNSLSTDITNLKYVVDTQKTRPTANICAWQNGNQLWFFNLPPQGALTVYTLNGRMVIKLQAAYSKNGVLSWDMRDRFGSRLASGIYIYVYKSSNSVLLGKFAVVR